jgi:hypothetical protein
MQLNPIIQHNYHTFSLKSCSYEITVPTLPIVTAATALSLGCGCNCGCNCGLCRAGCAAWRCMRRGSSVRAPRECSRCPPALHTSLPPLVACLPSKFLSLSHLLSHSPSFSLSFSVYLSLPLSLALSFFRSNPLNRALSLLLLSLLLFAIYCFCWRCHCYFCCCCCCCCCCHCYYTAASGAGCEDTGDASGLLAAGRRHTGGRSARGR